MLRLKQLNLVLINTQAILGLLGIISNLLTICVFSRKNLRFHSYSFYWRIMAFFDILIEIETFKNWSNFVFDTTYVYPIFILNVSCKLGDFLAHVSGYVSLWLLTIISIDRLLVIGYPNRFRTFQKRWFQLVLVSILVVYSVILHIRMPLNYRFETVYQTSNITVYQTTYCYKPQYIQVESALSIMINLFLAHLVINSILDYKLIKAIRSSKRKLYRYVYNMRWAMRDRKFAISSIVMNIASFLLIMPFAIGTFVSSHLDLNQDQRQAVYFFTGLIALVDKTDLFLINMLVNSIFYNEFLRMIKLK